MENTKWNMQKGSVVVLQTFLKNQQFIVRDDEEKTFVILLYDHADRDVEIRISIDGERAAVQILGIIVGTGKQQIRLRTIQDHRRPASKSDLLIKSVLFDQSRLHYEGLITIAKGAQQSNAYQKNQNLLISSGSWADSRPSLEILANDVRCTHGATIGTIDEEQMYYLASRGISRQEATRLIIEGFFSDVLQRIPDKTIAKEMEQKISKYCDIHHNDFSHEGIY